MMVDGPDVDYCENYNCWVDDDSKHIILAIATLAGF